MPKKTRRLKITATTLPPALPQDSALNRTVLRALARMLQQIAAEILRMTD